MSEIDLNPHKPIGTFLGEPLYLSLGNFSYQHHQVTTEDIIWRDDSSSTPAIINLRSCIYTAIEGKILDEEEHPDLNILKPINQMTMRNSLAWREHANYYHGYKFWLEYVELVGEENAGWFQYWAMEQIGTFIIKFYPELLTPHEKDLASKFTWTVPQGCSKD